MSVIEVDFTKKNAIKKDSKLIKTPVTFSLIDAKTGTELDILVVMQTSATETLTTDHIIANLRDARLNAEEQFASHVFDLDDTTGRNLEEIYDHILIDDIFLSTPSKRELEQYVVKGIKLDGDYINPSSRLVFAVSALDADLQVRLTEAIEGGKDLSMNFDGVLEYMARITCEEVTLAPGTENAP